MEKTEFWIGINDYPLYRFEDQVTAVNKAKELSSGVPDASFDVYKLTVEKIKL